MATLGDFLKSINKTKENIIESDILAEKDYVPFVINTSLSYFNDTILYANEMNCAPHLTNKMQYEFLLNSIKRRNRFSKWAKKNNIEHLDLIKEHYNINNKKAIEYLNILSDDQIKEIIKYNYKGTI